MSQRLDRSVAKWIQLAGEHARGIDDRVGRHRTALARQDRASPVSGGGSLDDDRTGDRTETRPRNDDGGDDERDARVHAGRRPRITMNQPR